jgi:sugar phosphate isomerase/epimerase
MRHPKPEFILDQVTLTHTLPSDVVRIASKAGYDGVSVWVNSPTTNLSVPVLRAGTTELRKLRRALEETGLRVNGVECFDLTAPLADDAIRRALAVAADLGARTATALFFAKLSEERAGAELARFADLVAEFDMHVTVEFMAETLCGMVNSWGEALRVIDRSQRSNVGITVDMLHLGRTHASPTELIGLPPSRIAYIQLCDAPLTWPDDLHIHEAGTHRLYPGEGQLPILAYLQALPKGIPFGIEVPRAGEEPHHVARHAFETAVLCVEGRRRDAPPGSGGQRDPPINASNR